MKPLPIKDKETFSRFTQFLQEQKAKKQGLLLIHDADGDGISSAKILQAGLKQLGIKAKYHFAAFDRNKLFGDFLLKFIEQRKIAAIFTTDLNLLATNYVQQKEALKGKTFIVFDHHELQQNLDKNVLYFHPALTYGFEDPSQYCTTKLVYDIMSEFADLTELDWVASIGLVADSTYRTWKDFVDNTTQKLGLPIPKNPFDSELQKVGSLLAYGLAMDKESAEKAIKTYFTAKSYTEAGKGLQQFEIVGDEIQHYVKHWSDFAEKHDDVIFIKIESQYKINSLVSSRISVEHPHTTIIVGSPNRSTEEKEEKFFSFSLRRQDKNVNLPKLLKEIATQLPGCLGGGHIPAAGAKCRLEDYEKFKALFLKLQGKYTEK